MKVITYGTVSPIRRFSKQKEISIKELWEYKPEQISDSEKSGFWDI